MPLNIHHPDASNDVKRRYRRYVSDAERIFNFGAVEGDFVSTGILSNDQFSAVLDGDPVVRHFQNMTINAGHTVTPNQRCKGMYLLIEGDLTVNGILSMTARGAKAAGKVIGIDPLFETIYFNETDIFSELDIFTIGKAGGLRTAYPGNDTRLNGNPGINGACGSGGSGGRHVNTGSGNAGRGGPGTSFSGGTGGGGLCILGPTLSAIDGAIDGGTGGAGKAQDNTGWTKCAGGGAGNPGGAGAIYNGGFANAGGVGTAGLIILIVKGNIIFGPTGQIVSKGSNGGSAQSSSQNNRAWGSGGGGGGGGAIHLFKKSNVIVPGEKLNVTGGNGGNSNVPGGIGGVGFIGIKDF